ncbi:MAG: ABC transporter substrate-binding protein [Gammaproteobacteria bacterium]|nr:ABC transporter substrate-binding protein [Gammaproteobacteria bacterium]
MCTHYFRNLVLIVVAMLFLTACTNTENAAIKLGINPWPGYEFLYLAQEMGFYEQVGVDVKIIEYGSLSDVRRGYERGNLDAMATTLIELLQVKEHSKRDPVVFLIADFSYGGDVIIARKSINSIGELKKKKIGADTTSLPIFILARALKLHNLSLDDIHIVPLEQTELEQAYINGELDAVVTYPPVSVRLQSRADSSIVFSTKEIPGEVIDVISVEKKLLEKRPEDIRKIKAAWQLALQYSKKNPAEAHQIMAKREGISAEEFRQALGDLQIIAESDQQKYFKQLKHNLENTRSILMKTGVLSTNTSAECCMPDMRLLFKEQ